MVNQQIQTIIETRFPASCGELVQGCIGANEFLCSYAIDRYSYCTLKVGNNTTDDWLKPLRQTHYKVYSIVKKLFDFYQIDEQRQRLFSLTLHSEIPIGKGFGSSTADLMAVLLALDCYFDWQLQSHDFSRWCTTIEPTDSIVYPNLSLVDPVTGRLIATHGQSFPFWRVFCLVPPTINETVMNRDGTYYQQRAIYQQEWQTIYWKVQNYFRQPLLEVREILQLALESAKLNQVILPKPFWNELQSVLLLDGIQGINVAHSGTIIAFIYDDRHITAQEILHYIEKLGVRHYYQNWLDAKIITSQATEEDWRVKKWKSV